MARAKSVKPLESPGDPDPLSRLISVLEREGFASMHDDESWSAFGEKVYRRSEKVLFASGETVFLLIEHPDITDKIIRQAMDSLTNLFRARSGKDKALSVFQTNTVYVCFVSRNEMPMSPSLDRYISSAGGSILVPVIIVPEINQVVYPSVEEKVGTVKPRIEYLQYLLGERFEPVDLHRQTVRTFYVSLVIAGIVVLAVLISAIF